MQDDKNKKTDELLAKKKVNKSKSKSKTKADKSSVKSQPTKKVSKEAKAAGKAASEPETMEELFAQTGYDIVTHKRGDLVQGQVIVVGSKRLLLDIGGKSEAVIHEKELPYVGDILEGLSPGDKISAHVVNPENDRGQTVVSLRRTAMLKRWDLLSQRKQADQTVEVMVKELSRGGFLVDYQGLRGFIPLSQAEPEFSRLGDKATGRRVKVKILELDRGANRLVFSQISHGVTGVKQQELMEAVDVGAVYKAEVTGIAPFGAFVAVKVDDDGSLPGLVHISEIAWEKVENPEDYVKQGETLDVKVIGVDEDTGKLTLSLKQLTKDPWEDVAEVFSPEQKVTGNVSRVSDYGVFVTLLPGIEGLIHISKMAPGEEPKVGTKIECVVEDIVAEKRKISLSLVTHAKPIGYR